jgi:predicted O-linked N-acetylglucosamine transferase (SPINDLY family)
VQAGQLPSALAQLREAHRLLPESPEILNNLGAVLEQLGQTNEAVASYQEAAALSPAAAVPPFNAGELLRKAGRLEEALPLLRLAATLEPSFQEAWGALGAALVANNEPAAACGALRRALELRPSADDSACLLGDALQTLHCFIEAIGYYEQAISHNPASSDAWYGLGRARLEAGWPVEAATALERCRFLQADHGGALHDLGKALFQIGCVEKAMPLLRRAAEVGSADAKQRALQNLATIVPGSPEDDNRSILETRRAWGQCLPSSRARRPVRERKLGRFRLGYVSSFFHHPNWMKPVWALVNQHDRRRFAVHLFSDGPASGVRGGYRPHPDDQFHDILGQANEAVAERIGAQDIDLLIDLNAYSAPHRLGIYPLRPTLRILGWFNHYATTGLDCFDYLVGDESVIPVEEEVFYTERILRVRHSYLTFEVDYPVPDIARLPMLRSGTVMTGCLASQYKLTDQVIATWANILQRCPVVRLLLRNATLGRPEHEQHLRQRFAQHGVSGERLLLEGPAEHAEFLRTYDRERDRPQSRLRHRPRLLFVGA